MTKPIPPDVSAFEPANRLEFNKLMYANNIRSARRGSSAGLPGDTNEHFKVLLDDADDTESLVYAAERFAEGDVPEPIVGAFHFGCLTALSKGAGKVRGIVAGNIFRR